jgi:hypothetical protein
VLKAARSAFCKRTRSLYRYMFPGMQKWQLNKKVLAAWDASSETEKNLYISEVTYIYNHHRAISLSLHPFSSVPDRNDCPPILFNL